MSIWWMAQLEGLLCMRRSFIKLRRRRPLCQFDNMILQGIEMEVDVLLDGIDISDGFRKA